jgi:hypothetical protein
MNEEFIKEQLSEWMVNFIEKPNSLLGNWAPCPYTRQARIANKIEVQFTEVSNMFETINEQLSKLEHKDVIIICFDHDRISPEFLQEFVVGTNTLLMKNDYVILEDHPNTPEYVNGVKMNFGHCGLLLLQKLSKLTDASNLLKEKGYYDVWSKHNLNDVVNWRNK